MAAPLFLPGGSLTLQASESDTKSPEGTYRIYVALRQGLETWKRQVSQVVNGNLAVSGLTGSRPTSADLALLPNAGVGYSMFDTTLGKPIWWNGTVWKDAATNTV